MSRAKLGAGSGKVIQEPAESAVYGTQHEVGQIAMMGRPRQSPGDLFLSLLPMQGVAQR